MLKRILFRYRELLLYILFGVLTTIVNFLAYYLIIEFLNVHYILANILSFAVAVIFAFLTNKTYVFNSPYTSLSSSIKEFMTFVTGRLVALGFETGTLIIMVEFFNINEYITKVIAAFFVVIINYVWSKLFVFKNK